MSGITINQKPIGEFSDDELERLNQQLGERVDAIQDQRRIINAVLAQRRAKNAAAAAVEVAARAAAAAEAASAAAERVDAVAPGALIIADASLPS